MIYSRCVPGKTLNEAMSSLDFSTRHLSDIGLFLPI